MDRLTLDTNLLLEYWKDQSKKGVVEKVLALGEDSRVDLAVTRRIRDDVPREPLALRLNRLHELHIQETGIAFTIGESTIGGADRIGSQEFLDLQTELQSKWTAGDQALPDRRDFDHLHAHLLGRRDFFLTWDKPILNRKDSWEHVGIAVCAPEDYLANLDDSQHP